MKTSIIIKENRVQLVLEPETDHDNSVIKVLEKLPNTHRTDFYDTIGGFTRMSPSGSHLLIVFDNKQPKNI